MGTYESSEGNMEQDKTSGQQCQKHDNHNHTHGPNCGHKTVSHGDHVDYEHDGHFHRVHGDHVDECGGPKTT